MGAGHNGLVCACYLAKAGYKVLVLERRAVVGGAVCTEEIWPGYKIDIGSSVHLMIHRTPIVAELELEKYGLEYIEMDPWAALPLPGGQSCAFTRTWSRPARVSHRSRPRRSRLQRLYHALDTGHARRVPGVPRAADDGEFRAARHLRQVAGDATRRTPCG